MHAFRSVWLGLPTFVKESPKNVVNPCLNSEQESSNLVVAHLDVAAGFTLTDISDARYQKAIRRREELGRVVLRAASAFRNATNSEDHIDAVISVTRAINICCPTHSTEATSTPCK